MLSEKRIRMTPQRQMILEVMKRAHNHPTASDVYESVRSVSPRISLGTVYRNLELLSQCGLIRKIEGMGTQKRFDWKLEQHHHVQCVQCGRIDDVSVELGSHVEDVFQKSTKYRLTGYKIDLEGICPQCGH